MSKGSNRRREDTAAVEANWDRVFGNKLGSGVTGSAAVSTTAGPGSLPGSPAIYVDNATGAAVTADWWPGDNIEEAR